MSLVGGFTAASARVNAALARRDGEALSGRDLATVRGELGRILFIRYRSLGPEEVVDLVSETMTRLVRESKRRGVPFENAAGWLVRVGANLAKDRLEELQRFGDAESEPSEEDQTLSVISREASGTVVEEALRLAIEARDATTVRIITHWLDLADDGGPGPSSRRVAEKSGYSHTTVNEALARFRDYLEQAGES